MITFKLKNHLIRPGRPQIIEIHDGDTFLGTIYAQEWGLRIISKYLTPENVTVLAETMTLNVALSAIPEHNTTP